jgi:hypothetical protein
VAARRFEDEEQAMLPTVEARTATFILRLELGASHIPIGSIEPVSGSISLSFRGWMDFMSALNHLRTEVDTAERLHEALHLNAG